MKKTIHFNVIVALLVLSMAVFLSACGKPLDETIKQTDGAASLSQIVISPASILLPVGNSYQFTASGYSVQNVAMVSISPSWEVEGDIGSISASGNFTASRAGSGKVVARYDGIKGTAVIEVTDNSSVADPPSNVQPKDTTSPPAPQNVSAMGYGIMVNLQWDSVLDPGLSGYKVFRADSRDGEYLEIATTSNTFFADGKVEIGKNYYYRIKAIDSSSNSSEFSSTVEIYNINNNAPSPPQGLSAVAEETSISLSWSPKSDSDLLGYNIYRRDLSEDEMTYTKVNSSAVQTANFHDVSIKRGHLYRYVVTAVNTSQREGYYSNPVEKVALPPGVQNNPPQITIGFSARGVSPNGDGVQDNLRIDYEINDDFSTKARNIQVYIARGDGITKTLLQRDNESIPFRGTLTWDGTDDNGVKFPDSNSFSWSWCWLYVSVYDDTRLPTFRSYRLYVDTSAPSIQNLNQNLYVFSPNVDTRFDSLVLRFTPNEGGNASFILKDAAQAVLVEIQIEVEALHEYKFEIFGNKALLFERNSNTSEFVQSNEIFFSPSLSDGVYSFNVSMVDIGGNRSEVRTGSFEVDLTPPSVVNISASPNPFTPNGDGINDTTNFSWTLSEPARVSHTILRNDGSVYRTYEDRTPNFVYPDTQSGYRGQDTGGWSWDGRGNRNELLEGTYSYTINMEDRVGNRSTSAANTVTVNNPPTLGFYMYATPDPFSPVNPVNNFTEIRYSVGADNSIVTVLIEGNSTIKTLLNQETQSAGEHSVRWYGDYDPGYGGSRAADDPTRVFDGSYVMVLQIENPGYAGASRGSSTVLVDNTPPVVVTRVRVDALNRRATLTYNVPENSTVEVSVYDASNNLITVLASYDRQMAGEYTLEWTGTQTGVEYYFKVIAVDRARNRSEVNTERFLF